MEQTINLYQELLNNLKNAIDGKFKEELEKETKIETFDKKWKVARQNIERYLQQITNQNLGLQPILLSNGYFLHEDVASLLIDLLWQEIHNKLEIEETIYFYKYYKIQITNKNLLTYKQN